jgi:CrcB protein
VTPLLALAVVLTGAAATVVRYLVSLAFAGRRLPWAVFTVNVVGSLIGGAVLGLSERAAVSDDLRLVLLTGLCGGLTTFSTFSVETVELVQAGRTRVAALSLAANVVVGVGIAALAYLVAR